MKIPVCNSHLFEGDQSFYNFTCDNGYFLRCHVNALAKFVLVIANGSSIHVLHHDDSISWWLINYWLDELWNVISCGPICELLMHINLFLKFLLKCMFCFAVLGFGHNLPILIALTLQFSSCTSLASIILNPKPQITKTPKPQNSIPVDRLELNKMSI